MNKLIVSFLAGLVLSSTFKVDNVTTAATSVYQNMTLGEKIGKYSELNAARIEAVSTNRLLKASPFVRDVTMNGLLETVHLAFSQHHGLTLSPEKIFIAILQGVSIHINQNPEKFRAALGIQHEGKLQLNIKKDDFVQGSQHNNWPLVFNTFKELIGDHIPEDVFSQLSKPFTTSTDLSVAVTSITIMDSFKAYFEFSISSQCGIPEITLQGTPEDWIDLKNRAQNILQRLEGLDKWQANLLPVLDQFISASEGNPSVNFWQSIYKFEGVSGGPDVSGWINVFFPYLQLWKGFEVNACAQDNLETCPGPSLYNYPVGFTVTPFEWKYAEEKFNMKLVAGLVGAEKGNNTNHVQPALGWAVIYA